MVTCSRQGQFARKGHEYENDPGRIAAGKPAVVFDVGANVGIWTQSLLTQSGQAGQVLVYAFEPCRETVKTLAENVRLWGMERKVTINPVALSSKTGLASFYSAGANVGINGLYPDVQSLGRTVEEVETITIDDFCGCNGIAQMHFLKIDAEGHDMEIMRGAGEMLRRGRIDMV